MRDGLEVVEVRASFEATSIAVAHVRAGERYCMGSAPGVELVIGAELGIERFDLIDGWVLRSPPACRVWRTERARTLRVQEPAIAIEHGATIELMLGRITLRVCRVTIPAGLPRPALEKRPYLFGAVSLAVQLAIVVVAMWQHAAPLPTPITQPGDERAGQPLRRARIALPGQTVRRAPVPEPAATPIEEPTPTPSAASPAAVSAGSRPAPSAPAGGGADSSRSRDGSEVAREVYADGRFDPTRDAAFDSVRSGSYSTVATGRAAGDDHQLPERGERSRLVVVRCDAATCVVVGGEAATEIRQKLQQRLSEIVACYRDRAPGTGREVELDFEVDGGKVQAVEVGGIGDVDSCVARIVRSIQFAEA